MYDYLYEMTGDVLQAIRDSYTPADIAAAITEDRDDFAANIHDDLWIDDDVTGNGSGAYTTHEKARDYVSGNFGLLYDMVRGGTATADDVLSLLADDDYVTLDVYIRCDLLYEAVYQALDLLEGDAEIAAGIEKLQAEAAG